MNEAQTRLDKIDPKLRDAGWGIVPGSNILVEYTAEPSLSCTQRNRPFRVFGCLLKFHFADKKFGRLNVSHYLCKLK